MQSSWGHDEAIASTERIARWHILCLRELQEETGKNTDMHIDSAELGRCGLCLTVIHMALIALRLHQFGPELQRPARGTWCGDAVSE